MIKLLNQNQKIIALALLLIFYSEMVAAKFASVKTSYKNHLRINGLNSVSAMPQAGMAGKDKSVFEGKKKDVSVASVLSSLQASTELGSEFSTGPSQPEMQSFQPVNSSNMVDLFSGDFSYNIPLLDVGGYPVNIGYRSGITMDQEASWVGLGWNINPGTITRNLRGLPDEFNGKTDTIRKTTSVKQNKTIGVTGGFDYEIVGMPKTKKIPGADTSPINKGSIGASLGVFLNSYKGWGLETGLNASINAGSKGAGSFTGGLSLTNNSQEGLTISPSLAFKLKSQDNDDKDGSTTSFSLSVPYNNRSGIKGLQLGVGVQQYKQQTNDQGKIITSQSYGSSYGSLISFASPTYTPSITLPYTSSQFSFTAKVGLEKKVKNTTFFLSGYVSKQYIAAADQTKALPAYGYLNYQNGVGNDNALLDFNREKDMPYREKPPVPHIGIPNYTYDIFSITGEGTGGMFRAYRSDVGFISDHTMRTRDGSQRLSVDLGFGDVFHGGVDLNLNRAFTQTGAWVQDNAINSKLPFTTSMGTYEATYFKNPGEKSIVQKAYYDALGGDDVVTVGLYQPNTSSSLITAAGYLNRYKNKSYVGKVQLNNNTTIKTERDKRAQVITYLTAEEASIVGLSKYIENYTQNKYPKDSCYAPPLEDYDTHGLKATYYKTRVFTGDKLVRIDPQINFNWGLGAPATGFPDNYFSAIWEGRLKSPITGKVKLIARMDDGVRVWVNDSLVIELWTDHAPTDVPVNLNLIKDEFYKIRIEYYERKVLSSAELKWSYGSVVDQLIPTAYLYTPTTKDTFVVNSYLSKEKRINSFRKPNHISEIDVLNADGRRYIYGIPVYNLRQKEVTFSANPDRKNLTKGFVGYTSSDNSTANSNGIDNYYNVEEVPAYAHSFLLTGILSADYSDITGDGITDDDNGDAIRFNYTKTAGVNNPYKWRAPYLNAATYNEGLKTYSRDDKGNYIYGEKELWYLNSIESKNMIAVFETELRADAVSINENGTKNYNDTTEVRRLKEIRLYSKADFYRDQASAKPIKTVHFEYSYELCTGINKDSSGTGNNSGKLTLKKIWFSYNGNEKGQQNPYVFKYHSTNPTYNINAYDRWGNYKNPSHNPSGSGTNSEYPYSLQGYTSTDSINGNNNAAAWTLNEVKLPSGGVIKVDYESDDYAYVQNRRAMQMFKIAGFGSSSSSFGNYLYSSGFGGVDNRYVFINVPVSIASTNAKQDIYWKYLEEIKKIYFRVSVLMPTDKWGSGYEYIPCYAEIEDYGRYSSSVMWVKVKGIKVDGTPGGSYSPMAKAAIQFLRSNLQSKAYPGSEVGSDPDLGDAVNMVFSQAANIISAFSTFDGDARSKGYAQEANLSKSYARLTAPKLKKRGGGLRVKRVTVYDNWNTMTGQKEATYGQEYTYTTTKEINGVSTTISSGVASWEPSLGNEENPFKEPIEYTESVTPLGPITLGYSEEPLGESLFPSPGVGYSKVRVRSINTKNIKSANGYEETGFYTAYDFPVITDRSMIDADNKKRFKPALRNFLRIDAKHFMAVSQGFKIELNDMHGKLRYQATYPETDSLNYITYTENFYKVENASTEYKKLVNNVWVIKPDGTIDTTAIIGKDMELMMDMREQRSVTNGNNFNVNGDFFSVPALPPFWLIPSFLSLAQREETQYRSAATLKVIQRFGILDSVLHVDKGSKVSTKNILYDSETGDVLLTRTQNEFDDPIYNFTYPAYWAYEGMGMAYRNVDVILKHINMRNGKIISGLGVPDSTYFSSGDEILVATKIKTGDSTGCAEYYASFPTYKKIWAIDRNAITGGAKDFYFIDADGKSVGGNGISMKIIRSGRRNMGGAVGSVTTLRNPLVKVSTHYELQFDTSRKIINATAAVYKQLWKVGDKKKKGHTIFCDPTNPGKCLSEEESNCNLECLSRLMINLFDEEDSYHSAWASYNDSVTVSDLVNWYNINEDEYPFECPLVQNNLNAIVYWIPDTNHTYYRFNFGTCIAKLTSYTGEAIWKDSSMYDPTPEHLFKYWDWDDPNIIINDSTKKIYYTRQCHELKAVKDTNFSLPGSFLYVDCSGVEHHISPPDSITVCTNGVIQGFPYYNVTDLGICRSDTIMTLEIESCDVATCDTIYSSLCYSSVTDTVVNPYVYGILGNYRGHKSYVYYSNRSETNPTSATNIKKDGTYYDYSSFWSFGTNLLLPQYPSKWVWNSEMTLFNPKGFELENKDPLGRYNSGLYGYSNALPVAVVQNSQYRESAFEGFEDYNYRGSNSCDTACSPGRHFDFGFYSAYLDTVNRHTGKYSLKISAGDTLGIAANISDAAAEEPPVNFDTVAGCSTYVLKSSKTNSDALLPFFTPIPGKRVVISGWVKEAVNCHCESYADNKLIVSVQTSGSGTFNYTFSPKGIIIDGWQRYEEIVELPSDATSLSLAFAATGSSDIYFDDIRIHPFNANMKSFVYNPVNLRLMAELDENNYATFYEYDDDGTLIRLKKETERGIKTIKETRSGLVKN